MTYKIYDCSPKAKARIKEDATDNVGTSVSDSVLTKYPFSEMKIGQCFIVPFNEANENSLRLSSYNKGKTQGKKFTVIKHSDHECFEVARIA